MLERQLVFHFDLDKPHPKCGSQEREKEIDSQSNRETYRHTQRQTHTQIERDTETEAESDRDTKRQTDTEKDTHKKDKCCSSQNRSLVQGRLT